MTEGMRRIREHVEGEILSLSCEKFMESQGRIRQLHLDWSWRLATVGCQSVSDSCFQVLLSWRENSNTYLSIWLQF